MANFKLTICTDNNAFEQDEAGEVAAILRGVVRHLELEHELNGMTKRLYDSNGNSVGAFAHVDEEINGPEIPAAPEEYRIERGHSPNFVKGHAEASFSIYLFSSDKLRDICLQPGEWISFDTGSRPTDEGWGRSVVRFIHSGGYIRKYSLREGECCDGYTNEENEYTCALSDLKAYKGRPDWIRDSENCRQFDARAAAAGY